MADAESGNPKTRPRRKTAGTKRTTRRPASAGGNAGTPESSATSNPLGLEPDHFVPPEQPAPADADVDLDLYEPPAPELLEWTPERASSILRAGGYLLHTADPVSREPEAAELWKATADDCEAIGPPLARILNRYEPARRLAGVSDEGELAFGMIAYARRNLATRGRALTAKRDRETPPEDGTPTWAEPPAQ